MEHVRKRDEVCMEEDVEDGAAIQEEKQARSFMDGVKQDMQLW